MLLNEHCIQQKKKKKDKKAAAEPPPAPSPAKKGGTKVKKEGAEDDKPEVWKWWEEDNHDMTVKWMFLEHKGPIFAPPYERLPKDVRFYYDGKHMRLSREAEEVAGFFGRMIDHDYTTRKVFRDNFMKDWRKVSPRLHHQEGLPRQLHEGLAQGESTTTPPGRSSETPS